MVASALVPISLWIVGLFTVAQVLKPRLPKYTFRIQRIMPTWISKRGLNAKLGSNVKLHNDNYVPIDIHALSFDLFYEDWYGQLDHIGQVTDLFQYEEESKEGIKPSPALWAMGPRQAFETTDDVFMLPAGGLNVISSLSWDLVKSGGVVHVPSSGVIHVKANKKIPMTLSILCDNSLDTWSLEMQGLSCELDALELGWVDLPTAVDRLRTRIISQKVVMVEEVDLPQLQSSEDGLKDDDTATNRIEWDDVLPMLKF